MKKKPIIISIAGIKLTKIEKKILINEKPWGIILFKRNMKTFHQTQKLIKSIKKSTKDRKFPILIDEEGGAVTRISNFLNNKIYSQKYFGDLFRKDKNISTKLYSVYINSICSLLNSLGININTVPVLDMFYKNTSKILKNRVFSANKNVIKKLSNVCINTYKKNNIGTVVKHIPGHGLAKSDSHQVLPKVKKKYSYLIKNDFACFYRSNSFFAMTAHVLYEDIDSNYPVTLSKKTISKIIRKKLKFNGILISDDICMKALKYDLYTNALKSLSAGCNLVLYCAGKQHESAKLLKKLPYIDKFTQKKTSEFYKFLS
tara:strand:+ start:3100 stop:4047 length:948 start_codon:yes stop_codon:yes gene_type:complete